MAGILDTVDQRTQLVGENRLELLMFKLQSRQLFALNVFKVQEVMQLPKLTKFPQSHPMVRGVATLRGQAVTVVDLSAAIGLKPIDTSVGCNLIVTEYNRTVQGFVVGSVDRIINLNWNHIMPPPATAGRNHYLTAVTRLDDNQIVEIIDVEKVLAEIVSYTTEISSGVVEEELFSVTRGMKVLVVDDSTTARSQVSGILQHFGIEVIQATDGAKAARMLKKWADDGRNLPGELLMVITDAEMPEMDGYRLTRVIREDPRMRDLYIVLNTSLSGSFNEAMVEKVGCDKFISKFQPDVLAGIIQERVKQVMEQV
ncbi:chemotaxis protein CheV [Balneatrix alpica]|uniref:Chemotaxis protein CheV n=1 Tax=Balneatrix alpica TaxID=75684 RepID=A0ABV5Z8I7_9GAMM|nr:chemotaxis protein CheV [Balneatrix alpica]